MCKSILLIHWGKKGGTARITYEIAKGLYTAGYNVYAVLSEDIYNRAELEKSECFKKLLFIYTGNSQKFWLASIRMLTDSRRKIIEAFDGISIDYSFCTMPYPWSKYIAKLAGAKRNYVLCHDPIAHSSSNSLRAKIIRNSTKDYDDVVVMTKAFIPIVHREFGYPEEKVHFMRHGLYNYGHSADLKMSVDHSKEINFLFFGSIQGYKGINVLLDAYEIIKSYKANVRLTIAGKGNIAQYVNKIKKLEVKLVNRFIDDSEIEDFFLTTNTIVVLPYLDATQSGVIPIAVEFGVPVIASDTGGLKEQLFNGAIGTFFEAGNSRELADRMMEFVNNRDLLHMRQKEITKYKDKLRWENIVSELFK